MGSGARWRKLHHAGVLPCARLRERHQKSTSTARARAAGGQDGGGGRQRVRVFMCVCAWLAARVCVWCVCVRRCVRHRHGACAHDLASWQHSDVRWSSFALSGSDCAWPRLSLLAERECSAVCVHGAVGRLARASWAKRARPMKRNLWKYFQMQGIKYEHKICKVQRRSTRENIQTPLAEL